MIFESGAGSSRASSFLASLRSSGAQSASGSQQKQEEIVGPLLARIDMLERRLQEMAKSLEAKEEAEAPPKPPSEMMIFLQSRMEVLESKLQAAQEEALRSTLLLREREEAQRKAQKEVEDLFRSIREQGRAATWDAKLREEFSSSQKKIEALEIRLKELQLGSISAEEVLRFLNKEEGRVELEKRLQEKLKNIQSSSPAIQLRGQPSAGAAAPEGHFSQETSRSGASASVVAQAQEIKGGESGSVAILMGRLADLERRLEETEQERDQEKARRILWEKDILAAISKEPGQWQKTGGAQLVVEAALENLAQTFKQRDILAADMTAAVSRLQQEPPNSPDLPALRAHLASVQDKMQELQGTLSKHMAIVQAWLKQGQK